MMETWRTAFREGAAALALSVTAEQEDQFARFLALLLDYNQRVNLTAITEPSAVAVKHFVDSLTALTVWHPHAGDPAFDLGSGAGFPGIPLAIMHPEITVVLNDSVRKKVDFLHHAAATVPLANVSAVWARAEELARQPDYRERFNAVFARAIAHLAVLAEYGLPLLKVGDVLICWKGPGGVREVEEIQSALELLGGRVAGVYPLTIASAGERVLILIRKTRRTPQQFPRPAGIARKKPLFLDSTGSNP